MVLTQISCRLNSNIRCIEITLIDKIADDNYVE